MENAVEIRVYDKSWDSLATKFVTYPEGTTIQDVIADAKALATWVRDTLDDEGHPPAKINIRPKERENSLLPFGVTELAIRLG